MLATATPVKRHSSRRWDRNHRGGIQRDLHTPGMHGAGWQELDCPCQGSVFIATTGEVVNGPANRALDKVNVTVSGHDIVAG
jgi:Rieske Fe-S protein